MENEFKSRIDDYLKSLGFIKEGDLYNYNDFYYIEIRINQTSFSVYSNLRGLDVDDTDFDDLLDDTEGYCLFKQSSDQGNIKLLSKDFEECFSILKKNINDNVKKFNTLASGEINAYKDQIIKCKIAIKKIKLMEKSMEDLKKARDKIELKS